MPARLKKIRRSAKKYDIEIEEPSSGSHWKCRRDGSRVYTIPASNGLKTEIGDEYIVAFCKHFGVDVATFKKAL